MKIQNFALLHIYLPNLVFFFIKKLALDCLAPLFILETEIGWWIDNSIPTHIYAHIEESRLK